MGSSQHPSKRAEVSRSHSQAVILSLELLGIGSPGYIATSLTKSILANNQELKVRGSLPSGLPDPLRLADADDLLRPSGKGTHRWVGWEIRKI